MKKSPVITPYSSSSHGKSQGFGLISSGFVVTTLKKSFRKPQVRLGDGLGPIHGSDAALAVAKTRLSLKMQQTLKVLPGTPRLTSQLEQTTVELAVGGSGGVSHPVHSPHSRGVLPLP
jgi:hypothetical protein